MARTIPYADDMDLGRGYNLLLADALPSTAVTGTPTSVAEAGGQRVQSEITRINNSQQLDDSMGVSVEASGGYGGFNASAKVQYSESSSINSYSTYLLVKVVVKSKTLTLSDPVLVPDAAELIENNNPSRFRDRFGDVFQSGLIRGGEFYAVVEISGFDKTERESTALAIEASFNGVIGSADLQVKISSDKQASVSQLNVSTRVFRNGATSPIPYTIEEILRDAKVFNTEVDGDKAYAYAMIIEDYRSLKLPNDEFNPLEIEQQQSALNDIAKRRYDFVKLRNDLDFILKNPSAFDLPGGDITQVRTWFEEVSGIVDDLQKSAIACSKDASRCVLPTVTVGSYPLPALLAIAPKATAAPKTTVPDFTTCTSEAEATKKAADARVVIAFVEVGESSTYKIDKSTPAAGERVEEGAQVLVTKRRYVPAAKANKPTLLIAGLDREILRASINVSALKDSPVHRIGDK